MDLPLRFRELAQRLEGRGPSRGPVPLGETNGMAWLWEDGALHALPWEEAQRLPLDLGPLLDHTLLKAGAIQGEVEQLAGEARAHGFASICINPVWVPLAARLLQGSPVRVCTVVGFPLGATSIAAKAFEARRAVEDGAQEVDMVLDLGAARGGDWAFVLEDLRALRAATPRPTVLKVILETCLLDEAQKVQACRLAKEAGLDFVKTSTGFSTGGATETDVALMRSTVGEDLGVKASGGIRNREQALAMLRAGATRLGVSASLAIMGTLPASAGAGY